MKATELRIWSKVYYEGRVVEVTAITRSGIFTDNRKCGFNQINPIELTEEWLLKFGFKSKKGSATLFLTDQIYWNGFLRIEDHYTDKCKTVHQLQNLYFCLTGEELKIK